MRYRFLFLLLLLTLSACTFQVDVLTPEPVLENITSTPYSPEPGMLTATPPPFPTFTFTPMITASPIPSDPGTYPIRFAPNGTYIDVVDTILAGTSKTYSINAMKGQVMSISIHQSAEGNWTVVPIKIVGADGKTICPSKVDGGCSSWRGVLPASQDYFVTLTPVIDVEDFTLRVAINPLGTTSQSFQYVSKNNKAIFSYPDDFAPTRYPEYPVNKIEPEHAISYINVQAFTDTNLVEAYFLFGSSDNTDVVGSCLQVSAQVPNEQLVGNVSINGRQFVRSEGGGVAAGNIYEQTYYRAASQGVCYEITFFVHYGNIGNYSPDLGVKEFDRTALMQKFEAILSTLIIK